ncbi:hypothetical protein LCGC14_0525710 [marine sediment metagenome]|uniref:Uncharacterized protein n=1 Tax=marine sediment metagenome TaxID=412755 RepID=A0A0F9V598_9ZZZZ|nr:hypothetical protein [bacterium]
MNKITPNQSAQIKIILIKLMNLSDSAKLNNFFSLKYMKTKKSKNFQEKQKINFFDDIQILPKKEDVVNLFQEFRYNELLSKGFIKEYQIVKSHSFYIRPTLLAFKLAMPEDFDSFLNYLEGQFEKSIINFTRPTDLNSIQLAILFFLILNGNFGENRLLNLSSKNPEIEKFLTPWLESFSSELEKEILKKRSNIASRTLKAHFRTHISLINNSIGYPIKAPGGYKYWLEIPFTDYTNYIMRTHIENYDHITFQKILYQYFKKLNLIKGKMELSGIKSHYDPLQTADILAKFNLKISIDN